MSKKPSLSQALKPLDRRPAAEPTPAAPARAATKFARASTRVDKRAATVYLSRECFRLLKILSAETDMTQQDQLREAINDWLQKNGKPAVA